MAVSNGSEHRHRGSFWETLLGQLSRYDLVLTAIPLVLTLAFVAYVLFPLPFEVAVASGAVLNLVLIVDAMFLNPPASPRER